MAAEPVLLDTSVLVAASVEAHPGNQAARAYLAAQPPDAPLCISPQICREFLSVLTRQPVSGRSFTVEEALAALAEWRGDCELLKEDESTVAALLALVEDHEVRGKQVHDCNVVAVMRVHGVARIATRNADDFRRFPGIQIDAITP